MPFEMCFLAQAVQHRPAIGTCHLCIPVPGGGSYLAGYHGDILLYGGCTRRQRLRENCVCSVERSTPTTPHHRCAWPGELIITGSTCSFGLILSMSQSPRVQSPKCLPPTTSRAPQPFPTFSTTCSGPCFSLDTCGNTCREVGNPPLVSSIKESFYEKNNQAGLPPATQ